MVTPQIRLGGEFDSNLNYSFQNRQSDFILKAWPSVDFTYASEVSQYTGRLALTGMHYLKNSGLDKIDQNVTLAGKRQVLPRLGVTFSGSYILDTTLQEELTESGFIITRRPRQSYRLSPGLTYQLTERDFLGLEYGFGQVNYQDPEFQDYTTHLLSLRYGHLLANARTTLRLGAAGQAVNYSAGGNRYRILNLAAGVEHKVAEDFSLTALVGVNVTRLRELVGVRGPGGLFLVRPETSLKTGPFLELAVTRRWPRTSLTGGVSRTESASGGGDLLEYYRAFLGVDHAVTERLRAGVDSSVYYSTSSQERSDYENVILSFGPQVSYQLTERLTLTTGYRFGYREDLAGERNTHRHLVWLYLSYSRPWHYQR
ncbi:MAG: hypothetical protein K6T55_11925 [Syntrophobacterales bacterium]|nr:hypothetical protein [Syntrophobacterales bacterium]